MTNYWESPEMGRMQDTAQTRILDNAVFRKFKLDKSERLTMILAGFILAQIAAPIGSAIYFLVTQVRYGTRYGNGWFTWFYLKDTYDRLPIHISNLLGASWFHSQVAPAWWVTARHDLRHVLIGVIVGILIGAVRIGLKERKRASVPYMVASVPLAFLVAAVIAAPLIYGATFLPHLGVVSSNPWLSDWVGKGTIQLTLIGIIATLVANRFVLARTMDTIQLIALENRLIEKKPVASWWRFVLPNYKNRYEFLVATDHKSEPHGKIMGFVMTLAAPVVLFLLGFGVWLLYFGPAVGASH